MYFGYMTDEIRICANLDLKKMLNLWITKVIHRFLRRFCKLLHAVYSRFFYLGETILQSINKKW